jgi:pimeloyl-ACP methyl ester carboxylesterase
MPSHYPERVVQWASKRSIRAIWSRNPSGRALLFIHGYGGNPVGTWADFHELLPMEAQAAPCDMIFYDYDGLRADMMASAEIFRQFLVSLFGRPAALINTSLPVSAARPAEFRYKEIIVVGHSLGAVIARFAILQAHGAGMPWVANLKLILFAPAHMGASVVTLALSVISGLPFLMLAAGVIRFQSPLIDQLKKGSDELKNLGEQTKKALGTGKCDCLIARKVIHAEDEKIVSNLQFCSDPPAIPFAGDHFSVCKPKHNFPDPLNQVLEVL